MNFLTPNDISKMEYPAWLSLSSDGRMVAYSLFKPDVENNTFTSTVGIMSVEGEVFALISGADIPQFAPMGNCMAYLDSRNGEKQIWLRDVDGSVRQLTSLRHGVTRYGWSADGLKIVFEAPLWLEDMDYAFSPRTTEQKNAWIKARTNNPVVVEDLMYKYDEAFGVADGSVPCIGVVDVTSGEARILTDGKMPCHSPAFSPDGKKIAFYGRPYSHHRARRDEVFVLELGDGEPKQLTENSMCTAIAPPVFTGNGSSIVYAAHSGENGKAGFLTKLFAVPVAGGKAVCILPDGDDIGVDNAPHGRSSYGTYNPVFQPSRCGAYIFYTSANRGENRLYRLSLTSSPFVERIFIGEGSVHCFCTPTNNRLLLSRADMDKPCQLYLLSDDSEHRLTDFNAWIKNSVLARWQEINIGSRDGEFKIQGWVLAPPGEEKCKKYPAILNVHGGPTISFVRDFNLEFQAQAASGNAVILCNPRGSSGYGMACTDSALAWGQQAIDDLFDFVEAAVSLGFIDGERVGITGGSYGGYMTIKIIGRSNRFRAACAQRALCNTTTSYGTGDMGFLSSDKKMPEMLDFLLDRAKTSYINQIDNVKTPLLLLHGTNDYRCSFEQAEQMFIAMKDRNPGIPVRMVAFPNENHNVSRTGRPESQIVHMREIIDWFTQYLAPEVAQHD